MMAGPQDAARRPSFLDGVLEPGRSDSPLGDAGRDLQGWAEPAAFVRVGTFLLHLLKLLFLGLVILQRGSSMLDALCGEIL